MRSSEACGYVRSGPKDGVAIRAARPVKVAGFPWDDEEDLSDAEDDALGGNVPLATPARIQIVVVSEIPVTASVVFVGKQNRPAAWRDFHDDDKPKLVWDETRVCPEGFCECGWTRRGKGCCAEIASEKPECITDLRFYNQPHTRMDYTFASWRPAEPTKRE
jgi:hypothetical protein